jgi:DNA (cytosine-5)-methyltransferase 1
VSFAELREKAGLSVDEVSVAIGCSRSTVYRWERGDIQPKRVVLEKLDALLPERENTGSFRFIDLFAGIGAMRLGFESIGGTCVFTSEWDKYCRETYSRNFQLSHDIAGDIRAVTPAEIPPFDLLLAGFPCQPFSIAGVSKKNSLGRPHGFQDETQGNLFFKIHEILQAHRPAAFVLENVRNLVSHDRGITFEVIHRLLTNNEPPRTMTSKRDAEDTTKIEDLVQRFGALGYKVSYRVIDAKGWVPQHRERVFIVGFREDVGFDLNSMPVRDPALGPRLRSILHSFLPDEAPDGEYFLADNRVNPKYQLSPSLWTYLQAYAQSHRERGNGFGFGLVGPDDVSRTLSARYYKDGSEILVRQEGTNIPRRLTPRECARLMGFRKLDGAEWEIPVSDTQAYKQFGNAAVVPVVEHIARYMAPTLNLLAGKQWQPELPLELVSNGLEPVIA